MADATRTIDMVLNGVDNTSAAFQGAIGNTKKLSSSINSATQPFANATSAALKYEAALLATGAAVTAFAVKTAGDFDGAFREIATLIDAPLESLGAFRQEILDYAADSTGSLSEVTSSIYNAISAGVDYTDSLEAVRVAEQLSVAGKGELDSTLKLLVSSLNAYGLEMDQAGRFSDALFTTVKVGQTTLPELNASLQAVTGTAATLGVPFEEILGALAALTATGTPTAQAVTQINGVLAALLKPSAQASATARQLGIDFSAQAVQANGLQATLNSVAAATGGNEALMAKLFPRVESLRAVFPLTGLAADKFSESLLRINDSAGATETAYEKLANSLSNIGKRLGSSFEVLLTGIGDPLLDETGDIADGIGAIFSTLTQSFNEGELREITQFLEKEFGGFATALQGVAAALPQALGQADLTGFTEGLLRVRQAVQSLFGGLDLTDANDLARALEFVGQSFQGLSEFSAGAIESFGPLFRFFADLAERATEFDGAIGALGQFSGAATQINLFADALGGAGTAMQGLVLLMAGNQGLSLLGSLGRMTTALSGSTGLIALLGKLGIAAAAAAAGFGIGTLINELPKNFEYDSLSTNIGDLIARYTGLREEAEKLTKTEFFPPNLSRVKIEAADTYAALTDISGAVGTLNNAADPAPLANYVEKLVELDNVSDGGIIDPQDYQRLKEAGVVYRDTEGNLRELIGGLYEYPAAAKPGTAALAALAKEGQGTFSVVSSGATKAKQSIQDLAGASEELRAKAITAAIEGATDIQVARIQADAETITSAFQSIGTSVESATDSVSSLFDTLGSGNFSKLERLDLREQIDTQSELQNKLAERQIRLLDQQIRKLKEQASAFQRGDALISIDGAGLQPHLEAFMFEILESIQVRVNAEGAEFLLEAA